MHESGQCCGLGQVATGRLGERPGVSRTVYTLTFTHDIHAYVAWVGLDRWAGGGIKKKRAKRKYGWVGIGEENIALSRSLFFPPRVAQQHG